MAFTIDTETMKPRTLESPLTATEFLDALQQNFGRRTAAQALFLTIRSQLEVKLSAILIRRDLMDAIRRSIIQQLNETLQERARSRKNSESSSINDDELVEALAECTQAFCGFDKEDN